MRAMLTSLSEIFLRDLDALAKEIQAYQDEDKIWIVPPGVLNSGGNLALHICGNLRHFVGSVLGDTGYIRDRDAEFNDSNVPVSEIINNISETKMAIANTLEKLTDSDLGNNFPVEMWGRTITTGFMLTHLSAHLSWHLGQINYHRRMLDN